MTPLPKTSEPASQAFLLEGIKTLEDLTKYTKKELLKLHGVGPKAIRILEVELKRLNLKFKEE